MSINKDPMETKKLREAMETSEGMEIKVTMTAQHLFTYSMYNSYNGGKLIFSVVFTLAWIVILFATWNMEQSVWHQKLLMTFCILIFPVLQPYLLWNSTKKQAKTIGFSTPVTIKLAHNHIYIEQAGHCGDFEWARIKRFVRIKSMFIMDMGYGRGYLIPNESIQGREQELVDMVKKQLPETKPKGLKAFA